MEFPKDDTWTGGYYEACMVLDRPSTSKPDKVLRQTILNIWSYNKLGQYSFEPIFDPKNDLDEAISLSEEPLDKIHRLYGWFNSDTFGKLPFTTCLLHNMDNKDWLSMCFPLGGLWHVKKEVGAYPFGDQEHSKIWRQPLEQELADMVLYASKTTDFEITALGFEAACFLYVEDGTTRFMSDTAFANGGHILPNPDGYKYQETLEWD